MMDAGTACQLFNADNAFFTELRFVALTEFTGPFGGSGSDVRVSIGCMILANPCRFRGQDACQQTNPTAANWDPTVPHVVPAKAGASADGTSIQS